MNAKITEWGEVSNLIENMLERHKEYVLLEKEFETIKDELVSKLYIEYRNLGKTAG